MVDTGARGYLPPGVKKEDKEEYTVSLEDFQLRQSSPESDEGTAQAITKLL
jgi:hypothetical protein